jgi:nucleotide-binding universal stress UspA family protein
MSPIDEILVAVDFSDHSLPSLAYAASLARALAARLILANILNGAT